MGPTKCRICYTQLTTDDEVRAEVCEDCGGCCGTDDDSGDIGVDHMFKPRRRASFVDEYGGPDWEDV